METNSFWSHGKQVHEIIPCASGIAEIQKDNIDKYPSKSIKDVFHCIHLIDIYDICICLKIQMKFFNRK
jgi:hypothetical protein